MYLHFALHKLVNCTLLSGSEKLVLRGALVRIWSLDRKLIMEKVFVDKVEDNVAIRTWSEMTQRGKRMNEQWVTARIKQKGDSKCIPWKNLKDLILAHPDTKKKVDVFALSIYGLVFFPKALGHVDEAVSDLFDRLDRRVTPVPMILAETFMSLNACRKAGEGRFIGCA
ncbi:hypothetical protein Gotur_034825 [Gossypium turneri]